MIHVRGYDCAGGECNQTEIEIRFIQYSTGYKEKLQSSMPEKPKREFRVFKDFAEADAADEAFYRSLTGDE